MVKRRCGAIPSRFIQKSLRQRDAMTFAVRSVIIRSGFLKREYEMCADQNDRVERHTYTAMWKGWRRKCPNCGKGPLLRGYLTVHKTCAVCREELFHHRADDGPAYLTILIVGHIMAPSLLIVFQKWRPEPLVLFTIFSIGCVALSLYLLPRLKGAIVGFQWSRYMHGFQ